MSSTIGWLDQSEEQQRRMRAVIALFAEKGTVDDIGIGVVPWVGREKLAIARQILEVPAPFAGERRGA